MKYIITFLSVVFIATSLYATIPSTACDPITTACDPIEAYTPTVDACAPVATTSSQIIVGEPVVIQPRVIAQRSLVVKAPRNTRERSVKRSVDIKRERIMNRPSRIKEFSGEKCSVLCY